MLPPRRTRKYKSPKYVRVTRDQWLRELRLVDDYIDWPENIYPLEGNMKNYALILSAAPLRSMMQRLHIQHCTACGCSVRSGEVVFRERLNSPTPVNLCRGCGLLWSIEFGTMSISEAAYFPTHGLPASS